MNLDFNRNNIFFSFINMFVDYLIDELFHEFFLWFHLVQC